MTGIQAFSTVDGELLWGLHLGMYADSPHAFAAMERRKPIGFRAGQVGRFVDGAMNSGCHHTVTLARAWTDPPFRRQGVGETLVNAGRAWAQQRQAKALAVQVTGSNEAAIRFSGRASRTRAAGSPCCHILRSRSTV
jgi:ribosomal protein S18 acetylase RimI-like enzyme